SAGEINEGLALGGGVVNNHVGAVIYSDERAITVDDSNLGNAFGPSTITNEGTIQGANGEAISITDNFGDTITNKRVIMGCIAAGAGHDLFNPYTGSSITCVIDGHDGADTINLYGTGTGAVASFVDVEAVNLFGGDWTLGSESASSVTFMGAGTLRLAAPL